MEQRNDLRQRVNDDRRRRFGNPGRTMALVCECGDPNCHKTVLLSPEEYDARRPGLILDPEHAGFGQRIAARSLAGERFLDERGSLEGFPLSVSPVRARD